jgi:YidC/Oxa1 family membrane protein insertase
MGANDNGMYLNVSAYDGEDTTYVERSDLKGGGFLNKPLLETLDRDVPGLRWAAVKNQFFAAVYTPDQPGRGVSVRRVRFEPFVGTGKENIGITAAARFEPVTVAPGASATLGGLLYVGPKEYTRLARFAHDEDRVMQFDFYFFNRLFFSRYVAPLMNHLMVFIHDRIVPNWGWAIVLMTIALKIITLPLTLAASKSAKKMAKFGPLFQEINEKYKDNPTKKQQAIMELYKQKGFNPVGGCLPILLTIPLFVGFFAMLQGTAELRFQPFLWAHDLSAPDTIWRIPGLNLPLNIMPLLMGATMIVQMRLTPTSPNMDPMQAKMMKFMPWVFALFCYNFSCALALYSTVNGLFTIFQQLAVNKFMKDDDTPAAAVGGSARAVKNVTPRKA